MKMPKRLISAFLAMLLFFPSAKGFAEGERKRAEYLDFKNPYVTVTNTPKDIFLEYIREDSTVEVEPQNYMNFIYGTTVSGSEHLFGAEFLVAEGARCDLIDCGTLIRTESCEELFSFLTEINEFSQVGIEDCVFFGGSAYACAEGDLIFWFDEAGNAVNVGIITDVSGENIRVSIYNAEFGAACMTLNSGMISEDHLENAAVVHILYPYYEHLIFLFLYNEMGYNASAASGILANMYCESELRPYVQESSGYGYGICQWTRAHRGDMESWCTKKGLNYTTLYAQLKYLKYDIQFNDPDLDEALKNKMLAPFAAGEAAELFCSRYEGPSNGSEAARIRSGLATTSFFNAYSGHPYM